MASPRVVLATATAAQASTSLLGFGLPSIGPDLREEFDIGLTMLGAVLTANVLGSGLALIAAGIAVDRYGARRSTLVGTGVAVAGLVAAAFAPSAEVLIALLFATGVGAALVPIAGMGAVFRAYEVHRRGWALGVRQTAVPASGVIAAVLLPTLASVGDAQLVFLVIAACIGVCTATFAFFADEGPLPGERPRPELRRVLRTPGMGRLLMVAGCYIFVLDAVLVYGVPSARDAGLSKFAAGAMFFAIQVTAGVARIAWGRMADRDGGTRRVRTLVDAGWVAAMGGLLFTLALHGGAALVIPAAIVFAFGALGWNALVYVVAGEQTPPELAGQAVAVAATLVFCVTAATTPPMGTLAEHAGWDAFWLVSVALAVAGALVAVTLSRGRAEPAPAPSRLR